MLSPLEEIRKLHPGFQWSHLRQVVDFHLERLSSDEGEFRFRLGVTLVTEESPQLAVTLRCDGVSNLRLANIGRTAWQVTGFDVADVSGRGWEGLRWEILDFENGAIRFFCREIEVEVTAELIR